MGPRAASRAVAAPARVQRLVLVSPLLRGFAGLDDLMGVLKGGAFLAVECKATGKHATPEQAAFLDNVSDAGGHSICVDDAGTLLRWLDSLNRPANGSQNATEPGK